MPSVDSVGFDFTSVITIAFTRIIQPLSSLALKIICAVFLVVILFAIYVIIRVRINPFTRGYRKVIKLKRMDLNFKPLDFIRWVYIDMITNHIRSLRFAPFGFTIYCGRQGAGKTISMIEYANRIRARYPDCIIVANFQYEHADYVMKSWRDLFTIRNGQKGVLFLIDEIHSEYSSSDWKSFPENLLSEISMQRKQNVKICATSQVYSRVVKQIREQTFSVVQCTTFANRWTFTREYDSISYEVACDSPEKKKKLKAKWKHSFVQDDYLRKCYNTYEKIKRMKKISDNDGFMSRKERTA